MPKIAFHTTAEQLAEIPHPYPASQHVPEWFKSMPADWPHVGGTLKRCPPFLVAMGAGYIIPAPSTAHLEVTDENKLREVGEANLFSGHFQEQYEGAPFSNNHVVKFANPWIIVTPPEYVCLITAPINRFEMPFIALTGIVETGTFYRQVKLPMVCMLGPGQSCILRRGDPMIQVIPVRRDEWTSETAPMDHALNDEQKAKLHSNRHAYKEEFWKKMVFT